MKIIIAGAGEVGRHLAKMLSTDNQDIILLDQNQARLDVIDAKYNFMTWNGSPYSFATLSDINVEDADLFIAVTPYETNNIVACCIAKELGAKKTVARIDNSEFLVPKYGRTINDLGVNEMIYPENLAANEIATALNHNWARYWGEFHDGKLLLVGVKIYNQSKLLNVKLKDLPVTTHDFHIAAIRRNNLTIIPNGNDEIMDGDIVYFITTPPYLQTVRNYCGKQKHVIKKVLIMGGSRIARRFAVQYHEKYRIKIIESDYATCEKMATNLPDCEIVYGDGRDIEVLRENNLDQYDAFLAMTDSSETNILACITAINKKLLASSRIYQLLLDTDQSNSRFLSLASADVAEIAVRSGAKITKAPVRELHLPAGMTLAALVRGDEVRLVDGNTKILAGDFVVVFSLQGTLEKIEKWFS